MTLREHFDEKFKDLKEANEEEHAAVLLRLQTVEEKMDELKDSLGDVVTWKSLGVSIGVLGGLVGAVAGLASLLGV